MVYVTPELAKIMREHAAALGGAPSAPPPVAADIRRTSEAARASIVQGAATTPPPPQPRSIQTIAAPQPEGSPPRASLPPSEGRLFPTRATASPTSLSIGDTRNARELPPAHIRPPQRGVPVSPRAARWREPSFLDIIANIVLDFLQEVRLAISYTIRFFQNG